MISAEQLNAPYDISGLDGPGPKKPTTPTKPVANQPFDIKQLDTTKPSPVSMGEARSTDVEEYGKILDQGVYSDQDIDSERGEHQSVLAKTGHMLGNLPFNIVGSFLEGIGDLGLLAGQYGDDRTYTNGLIQAGEALHNLTGDIYMRNNHDTIGKTLSDPSWWIDQIGTLAEFSASYAALGAGVAGTIGKTAEGVANLLKTGELGSRIAQATSQLGTAGFMAYTMGANSAAQVFKGTYETQFQKYINQGDDPDTAKQKASHIAAQSAATTAQLTTAIGTGLALTGMGAYFTKPEDVALNILKKEVPQVAGETAEQWAARVKNIDPDAYATQLNPHAGIAHKLLEAGKMGVEMQQLQFGQKTGEELGKQNKTEGFLDQFGEFEHYIDRTMDKDGALAFAIGAVSGIGIDKLRNDVIPSRWADKIDPTTGQPIPKVNASGDKVGVEKKLYTPKAYSELNTQLKFTGMRDAIASDIDNYSKLQKSYLAAVKADNPIAADRAANEMFNTNNVSAITSGMGNMWKQTYDGIANLSSDDAIKFGYIKDPTDTSYKDKAQKASANMEKYQKMYDDLQQRYGTQYATNQGYKPIVDGLFSRKVNLDAQDENLKEHEERLKKATSVEDAILPISDPGLFDQHTAEYSRVWEASKDTLEKLKKDHSVISKLVDQYNSPVTTDKGRADLADKMKIIAREYQAVDPNANNSLDSIQKSMSGTVDKIQQSIESHTQKVKEAEDNMINSSTYTQWLEKNPGKSFNEYYDKVQSNIGNKDYAAQIDFAREKYKIAKQNAAEIEKSKNLAKLAGKYNKYMADEASKADVLDKAFNKELADRVKDKTTLDKAQRAALNTMADRYKDIRDTHLKNLNDKKERVDEINKELERIQSIKDFVRKRGLNNQKRDLEKQIAADTARAKKYDSLYLEHHVNDSTDTNPVDTNAVTIDPSNEPDKQETPASQDSVNEVLLSGIPELGVKEDINELGEKVAQEAEEKISEVHKTVQEAENALFDKLANQDLGSAFVKLDTIQQQLMQGEGFSYDALKQEVVDGALTQEEATNLLQALKEYVDAVKETNERGEVLDFQSSQLIYDEEPEPAYDGVFEDLPTDPIIDNSDDKDENYQPIPDNNPRIVGSKTVEANTIANSTLGFTRLNPDQNNEIKTVSNPAQQNDKTNKMVLKGGFLTPGTRLRYEVDTEYNGPKRLLGNDDDQGHESFQDYSDDKGKVPADKMGNVPIKVVDDKSGETIGYIRKHEWVTEKDKGTLRNIAERFDEDGNEMNSVAQSRRILDIRKEIVDRYNSSGEPTHGKVTDKAVGHIILNQETNASGNKSKVVPQYAFNRNTGGLLPDPKLEIAVMDNGSLMSGQKFQSTKSIAGDLKGIKNGSVMVLLPGANGQHIPTPLVGKNLGESGVPHNTISRAIELYLQYSGDEHDPITKEIRTLEHNTGHDISKEKGLRTFINQYFTYMQRFADTDTAMKPTGERSKFLFNVWDKIEGKEGKAWIKAAFSGTGTDPVYAKIDPTTSKLNQEFSDILRDGLKQRSKAVVYTRDGLRGINEKRSEDNKFKDAIYTSNGKWQHPEYNDYNEYVKSFSKTTAYGKNKLSDGSYVYVANPSISYDLNSKSPVESKVPIIEQNNTTKVKIQEVHQYDKSLADEFDNLFNAKPDKKIDAIGSRNEDKSQALNLDNLEKLRNLLSEEQRNGKTTTDVLRELQDRGHTGLSDGYNPFSLCL